MHMTLPPFDTLQVLESRDYALMVATGISDRVGVTWYGNVVRIRETTMAGFTNTTAIWPQESWVKEGESPWMLRYRAEVTRGNDGARWVGYCQSSYLLEMWRRSAP